MPFTSIQFCVGALAKAVASRRFSFQAFAVSQIMMDIEPGIQVAQPARWIMASAIVGSLTHVTLDGMMHADMPYTYLRALSLATPAYPGGAAVPELICLGAAILAAALLVVRDVVRRLWRQEQVEP